MEAVKTQAQQAPQPQPITSENAKNILDSLTFESSVSLIESIINQNLKNGFFTQKEDVLIVCAAIEKIKAK